MKYGRRLAMFIATGLVAWASGAAAGADFAPARRAADVEWRTVDGVKIPVPPSEHPRLYLRARDIADLKLRATQGESARTWQDMQRKAAGGKFKDPMDEVRFKMEVDLLRWLINGDETAARRAAAAGLEVLRKNPTPASFTRGVTWYSRFTGRQMCGAAAAYDWCYRFLTPEQKKAYIDAFMALIPKMECHWPPKTGTVTGHGSENDVMRDIVSVGIAIYDEKPDVYETAATQCFKYYFPARNWFYPGGACHQGDSYGPSRFTCEEWALFIFDRLGAGSVYDASQIGIVYPWIYGWRSDGQVLWNGDSFNCWSKVGEPRNFGEGVLLAASYWEDPCAMELWAKRKGGDPFFAFLWADPNLKRKPFAALPLSRYCGSPFGWMYARTGWGDDSVICEMKINETNFTNHQHMDAGAFQIYHKGILALDSGIYEGALGGYGSEHCKNYYWRTIAHNALLIHDPAEQFPEGWTNEGGQRLPNNRREPATLEILRDPKNGYETGKVLGHGFGPDTQEPNFTWLSGDITKAYNASKVREVRRSFVFANMKQAATPGALFVYDRVAATNPSFRKTWLLHSVEEPKIEGAIFTVDRTGWKYTGRLTNTAILPVADNREMEKIGGPGKEFWVNGKNYPQHFGDNKSGGSGEPGAWRIEISPKSPSALDEYLNVMQMTDRATGQALEVLEVVNETVAGARVGDRLVLFARGSDPASAPIAFDVPGAGSVKTIVSGLAPGKWVIGDAVLRDPPALEVNAESGALLFDAAGGGRVTLTRQ